MKLIKKTTAVILAALMLLTPSTAFGFCTDKPAGKADISDFEVSEYIFEGQTMRIKDSEKKSVRISPDDIEESNLPNKYDLRDYGLVTDPEMQYFGDCWSYSAISSLESNALVNGYGVQHFSKSHLCTFCFNPQNEGPYNDNVWEDGGNTYYAALALANYEGIANQKDFPNKTDTFSPNIKESDRFNHDSGFIIDDALVYYDINDAKKYIMENGAIGAAYYSLPGYDSVHSEKYNADMIYPIIADATNHVVTVIGWDDTVPASEFRRGKIVPSVNGAWIIKNSWYGDDRDYMYVSYDQSMPFYFGLTLREDTNILNNYTYAERGGNGLINDTNPEIANIFKAKNDERIDRVGFYLETDGQLSEVTALIRIYKNLPEADCFPDVGYLALSYSATLTDEGLITVELPKGVNVSEGEKFSVCISLSDSENCKIYIPTEQNTYSVFKGYSGTYKGAEGQSFIKLSKSDTFYDTYEYLSSLGMCDVFMQVYTSCNHKMSPNGSGYKCEICGKEIQSLCTSHTEGFTRTVKEATFTETGINEICCLDCGAVIRTEETPVKATPSVHIQNNHGTKTVKYGCYLHLKADIENPTENCLIRWETDIEGDQKVNNSSVYILNKTDYTVKAILVDSAGNPILDAQGNEICDTEHVTVKKNFFLVIIFFFRSLFGIVKIEDN